jgi:hypothetical protein
VFTDEEWLALIRKLRQLTDAGRIKWEINDHDLSIYVEINDVTYLIDSADNDGVAPWVLHVRRGSDTSWQEIDSITSRPETWGANPRAKISDLRDIAFRMALGGPQLAQSLLAEMSQIDPTAPPAEDETPF